MLRGEAKGQESRSRSESESEQGGTSRAAWTRSQGDLSTGRLKQG